MALSLVERVMARRQVEAMILSDPVMITPERKTKVPTPDGGWRWEGPTPQTPVQVTITPAIRRLGNMLVNTELGQVVDYPYVVLARHSADIRRDDTFTWAGDHFQVKNIHIETEVSVIAQVDYFGGSRNG